MRIEKSSALLKERYTYLEHASGLPIYVFPKQMTGAYALFAVRYGSLDSEFAVNGAPMQTVPDGIAHFLEHKLFEAPDGSDAFARFSALRASSSAQISIPSFSMRTPTVRAPFERNELSAPIKLGFSHITASPSLQNALQASSIPC